MIQASCNCGRVAFEITGDVSSVYVCHCSICRRFTGCNGIAVVVVPNDQFRWTSGEADIRYWKKPDHEWESAFCTHCGSSLPGVNDERTTFVPAGLLLEGAESLSVAHHIWVDSRAPWDVIGDDGIQHPKDIGSAASSG